jgi:hypothetical protein
VDNQAAVLTVVAKVLAKALLITFAYGLPALVAVHRRHERAEAIALLNLLLGWTVLGWLVLLAWALGWTPRRSRLRRRLAGGGRDGAWRRAGRRLAAGGARLRRLPGRPRAGRRGLG